MKNSIFTIGGSAMDGFFPVIPLVPRAPEASGENQPHSAPMDLADAADTYPCNPRGNP
jgi:hypothetical protein